MLFLIFSDNKWSRTVGYRVDVFWEMCPQSPNLCKMQPWEGTVTCMNMAPGVLTVKVCLSWVGILTADMMHSFRHVTSEYFGISVCCLSFLIEVHVWTFSCHSAILLLSLSACHLFFNFSIHLRTFLLFSCLLSRLWGAKQLLAFLLSFVCKVFGFSLPLLFSWEMAEAVFREGLEDLTEEKNIYGYF